MTTMNFADGERRRRRPSLTPMIDVVFLLLVFFMLAARFGLDQVTPLAQGGAGAGYAGAPRLVDIRPESVSLNGAIIDLSALPAALAPLMPDEMAAVILRGRGEATVQQIIDVADALARTGLTNIVLVE